MDEIGLDVFGVNSRVDQLITVTLLALAAPLRRLEHHRKLRVAPLAIKDECEGWGPSSPTTLYQLSHRKPDHDASCDYLGRPWLTLLSHHWQPEF